MNVAYAYSWRLHAAESSHVEVVIDSLRRHAVELGGEAGEVVVLNGKDAEAVKPGSRAAVLFTATVPGATEGKYGLATAGNSSWSWNGAVMISDVRTVSQLHAAAADLGLEVVESYGGMVFTSRRNGQGVVEVVQRSAFDGTDF